MVSDDYVAVNRDVWDKDAPNWVAMGERLWSLDMPEWGNWGEPENSLSRPLLPADMTGLETIELGCGTGYVSAWMVRRGARATAIDVSSAQLATARRLARAHQIDITYIEGNAEETGLPDASFDFAISEYGAAIWCPPERWLAEAWRLLRPGGKLVFLGNHPLALICGPLSGAPVDRTLHRPYRNLTGVDWTQVEIEPHGICFNRTMAGWFTLFRQIGFEIEDYQELYAPDWANDMRGEVPADWAKDYPVEQIWHLAKPG